MVSVFSIPAFFIVLREVLEACLVVGIVLAYLNRVGATQYRKWVWIGCGAGIACSVAAGLSFAIYYYVTDDQRFQGNAEKIFEGVTFLIAAILLTWMIIWMMIMGKALQTKMENKVDSIVDSETSPRRRKISIFLMIFVQVLREGIETVIFLIGTASADDVGGWRGIPMAGILALVVGLAVSYLVFRGLVSLDIVKFFFVSGLVLMAFAAGLVSHAFHELQEVDLFGPWKPVETRDWYNFPMWSTEGCCDDGDNEFFSMLRALFGYQDKPTFVEWGTYFGYWLIVAVIFVCVNWSQIRAARSSTASRAQAFSLTSLLFTFVGFIYVLLNRTWIGLLTMSFGLLLSIVATYVVFDVTANMIQPLMRQRRMVALGSGICLGMLTVLMTVLHLVEMECEDFLERGREDSAWPALAALSLSIVVTVFFFGSLSFLLILFAFNVDSDGNYIDDDAVLVKSSESGDMIEGTDSVEAGRSMEEEEQQQYVDSGNGIRA